MYTIPFHQPGQGKFGTNKAIGVPSVGNMVIMQGIFNDLVQ
jgi:hypothetical protein